MYKINDLIYVQLKGLTSDSIKEVGLYPNRFGHIIDMNDDTYRIKLVNKNNIIEIDNNSSFRIYNINELIDMIRNLNIKNEAKDKYIELIDDILQERISNFSPCKYI